MCQLASRVMAMSRANRAMARISGVFMGLVGYCGVNGAGQPENRFLFSGCLLVFRLPYPTRLFRSAATGRIVHYDRLHSDHPHFPDCRLRQEGAGGREQTESRVGEKRAGF